LTARGIAWGLTCAMLVASASGAPRTDSRLVAGPYDIKLLPTPKAPGATGTARLVYASSPYGVAVTEDGRASYDVEITAAGLPQPSALGPYATYVAWAATPDLTQWVRLGTVTNGKSTVGSVQFNKFLLVISAEGVPTVASQTGPTVLHGTSPSGYLQSFLSHPLFRGVPQ
jgi:hypothetical protein